MVVVLTGSDRYTMIFVCPVLFVGWKVLKGTRLHRAEEIDLVKYMEEIEEYHWTFVAVLARYGFVPLFPRTV